MASQKALGMKLFQQAEKINHEKMKCKKAIIRFQNLPKEDLTQEQLISEFEKFIIAKCTLASLDGMFDICFLHIHLPLKQFKAFCGDVSLNCFIEENLNKICQKNGLSYKGVHVHKTQSPHYLTYEIAFSEIHQ